MSNQNKIHIFGASGSGVSTLGKNLAHHLGLPAFDGDDYYWKKTNPPFVEANTIEDRKILLRKDLTPHSNWIVSGSLINWGDDIVDQLSIAFYLYVPQEERIRRIKMREKARFGSRIEPGGDMYEGHEKFVEWARHYDSGELSGRNKPKHEAWMKTLKCPIVRIEGILSEDEVLKAAKAQLKQYHLT